MKLLKDKRDSFFSDLMSVRPQLAMRRVRSIRRYALLASFMSMYLRELLAIRRNSAMTIKADARKAVFATSQHNAFDINASKVMCQVLRRKKRK